MLRNLKQMFHCIGWTRIIIYNLQFLASNLSSFTIFRFWFTFSPKTISSFIVFYKNLFFQLQVSISKFSRLQLQKIDRHERSCWTDISIFYHKASAMHLIYPIANNTNAQSDIYGLSQISLSEQKIYLLWKFPSYIHREIRLPNNQKLHCSHQ